MSYRRCPRASELAMYATAEIAAVMIRCTATTIRFHGASWPASCVDFAGGPAGG